MDEQELERLKEEMESVDDSSITELPFELFDKLGNRTTKLIARSDECQPIDGRHRWHEFVLRQTAIISRLVIEVAGYEEFDEFEFCWTDEGGFERETNGFPENGKLVFEVNDLCHRLAFRPPSVFFRSPKIVRVRVEGLPRESVRAALDSLSDLATYRDRMLEVVADAVRSANVRILEAEKASTELSALQREITQAKSQIGRVKKSIDDLSLVRSELIAQNAASESSLKDQYGRLDELDAKARSLARAKETLEKDVQSRSNELAELKANINLFPTEIVAFVNQGSRNIKQYFWIALAPIGVIVVMFVLLVRGAADLTTVITNNPDVNIQAIMLSRTPYVAVSIAIIAACYKLARAFILEMIKINNQRLNLTKISIIAKDVSTAAEHGLGLDEEATYRLRTELKMQLLKDHLKGYISKEFTVDLPNHITGLLSFASKRKVSEDTGTQ